MGRARERDACLQYARGMLGAMGAAAKLSL